MAKRLHLDKADGDWMVKLREQLGKDSSMQNKSTKGRDWNLLDHPRDRGGRFDGNGGGSDSSGGSSATDGSGSAGSSDNDTGNFKPGTDASGVLDQGEETAWGEPGPDGTVRGSFQEEQDLVARNPNWEIAWRDNFWGITVDSEGDVDPSEYDSGYVAAYIGPNENAHDLVSGHDEALKSVEGVQTWIDEVVASDAADPDAYEITRGVVTRSASKKRSRRDNEQRTHKERNRVTKAATSATWETSDASHRLTLRASADFAADSYRRKDHQDGIVLIIGKHSDEDSILVQSVVFDRDVFGEQSAAKSWWEDHHTDVDKKYRSNSGAPLDSKAIREMGGINKRVVAVHAAAGSAGALMDGVGQPNDEQMALINGYTRSPKTPDQVAVFPVLACNDVVDRDVDQFTTKTVRGFMALEGSLSPLGKSFMVGHDYSKLPVGRIFNGEVTKQDDVTWLKLWTYIPKTPQYEAYLENVDFGVYWAVSVGVMLGASTCSIGEPHDWGWHPYVCSQMHMKGEKYKENGETDSFGQPVPATRGGDLAFRKLEDPTDFYELSQVYLGAQYMAEFDKGIGRHATKGLKAMSTVKGVRTAATLQTKSKVTMLSSEEAAKLPPLFPAQSKASEAAADGIDIKLGDDGLHMWVDHQGLVWTFSMESEEELCLGRKAPTEEDDTTVDAAVALQSFEDKLHELQEAAANEDPDEATTGLLEALEATLGEATEALEAEDEDRVRELIAGIVDDVNSLMEKLSVTEAENDVDTEEDDEDVDDDEEAKLSKRAVMKAATTAKLPSTLVEAISKATGDNNGLDELLTAVAAHVSGLEKQVADMTPLATAGEARIKELRAEAIHWYVMSNKGTGDRGVNTARIERLLDMAEGDIELMKELKDQYQDTARARFPEAVRRSSFPDNINERSALGEDVLNTVSVDGVKRIHG